MMKLLATSVIALCASTAAMAVPYPDKAGPLPSLGAAVVSKPEPVRVSVRYDAKRNLYCVAPERPSTGTRIVRTKCRTAEAWNKSGELAYPVG